MSTKDEEWLLKEKYHGEKTEGFFTDCRRLEAGEPLAYVIGFTPFLNATIWLDSHPLIPRVETEYLVHALVAHLSKVEKPPFHTLDLCAGSGCIGIALAQAFKTSKIDFVEIDDKHLATIKKNCTVNNIEPERTKIIASDLFSSLTPGNQYDLIVSNPPYLDADLKRVAESVVAHEPALALYGGKSGLEIINKIIDLAPMFLARGGELWLEHEPEQVSAIQKKSEHTFTVTTHKDQYGTPRFSQLVLQ
ncbi:MAG: HemK/PrmC family methyltransferase [Candidatus Paceibacterota bacterium]